jgi:hypothetical protein
MEWKTPEEAQTSAFAGCKGKAVALYNAMHSRGAQNLRLVIGKRLLTSRKTHAWVEWSTTGGTYVLDPTINWGACRADRFGRMSYIPIYVLRGRAKISRGGDIDALRQESISSWAASREQALVNR